MKELINKFVIVQKDNVADLAEVLEISYEELDTHRIAAIANGKSLMIMVKVVET